MHDAEAPRAALSDDDLAAEGVAPLPDRQAMSRIGLDLDGIDNFAMPINEATAANIASTDSIAMADADQIVIIHQVVDEPEEQ
jgi:hypothetical protein